MYPVSKYGAIEKEVTTTEPVHEIKPGETYQIHSSDYDSEEERDNLGEEEYDALVDEGKLFGLYILVRAHE